MQTGLERFLERDHALVRGKRIGLITNHSAVDRRLSHAIDLLHGHDDVRLAALFSPEHGVRGIAQAGERVASGTDHRTGLAVYSLYGETRRPTDAMLQGLDALIYDIQDVGVRYATYLSTLLEAMYAAAAAGLALVALDRPDPLNGVTVQGNVLAAGHESFVGAFPLATRHGLTAGEFASMVSDRLRLGLDLTVVPLHGWQRRRWYDETGLPWIPPTPNLPTLTALTLYPGTCLIEGTNLSEGRGTTTPFEVIGAPWLDADRLAAHMSMLALPGILFRPTAFVPTFSKHAGAVCQGIHLHIADRTRLDATALGVYLLSALHELHPRELAWTAAGSDGHGFFLDLLAGTPRLRLDIDAGIEPAAIIAAWHDARQAFEDARAPYLLYGA